MTTVGYVVGSLARTSINRRLATYLADRAPQGLDLVEVPIADLPLYSYDLDDRFPAAAVAFKEAVERVDALLFVTPEYNRSIPGALKNAIDWGSRPWGENSFVGLPVGIVGTGLNGAGTAVAQAQLRSILGYLGATVLGAPELCLPWQEGVLETEATAYLADHYWRGFAALLARPVLAVPTGWDSLSPLHARVAE